MPILVALALALAAPSAVSQTFTASPFAGLHEPIAEGLPYNPSVSVRVRWVPTQSESFLVVVQFENLEA